jgi:hypothetical protein
MAVRHCTANCQRTPAFRRHVAAVLNPRLGWKRCIRIEVGVKTFRQRQCSLLSCGNAAWVAALPRILSVKRPRLLNRLSPA